MIAVLVVCTIALLAMGIIWYWMNDSSKPKKPQP